jgi:hypothetical protein
MHVGQLEQSGALVERCLRELGHGVNRPRPLRALVILGLLLRVAFRMFFPGKRRAQDDLPTEARLWAYALAVPHFQFTSKNAQQLEFALRYRLLGSRSSSPEYRQEAHAMALILLLPFAHLGTRIEKRVDLHFARLEKGAPMVATDRGRAWLPFLRALYAMVSGRPDRAIVHFDHLADFNFGRSGYVALQRQNALFLAGAYERYIADLTTSGDRLRPLDIARLAYIERVRGHHETARRLVDDIAHVQPEDVPWTHRSLYTYQLVELKLLDGDTHEAARLARSLLSRIRRGAVSPTTGAFESADAVARSFVGEARRLMRGSHPQPAAAQSLLREAQKALAHVPLFAPPLFSARLYHDRAIVALALGRREEAMRHLDEAELLSRSGVIPCFRLRLLEDLLDLLPADDPRRGDYEIEIAATAEKRQFERRRNRAAWL